MVTDSKNNLAWLRPSHELVADHCRLCSGADGFSARRNGLRDVVSLVVPQPLGGHDERTEFVEARGLG